MVEACGSSPAARAGGTSRPFAKHGFRPGAQAQSEAGTSASWDPSALAGIAGEVGWWMSVSEPLNVKSSPSLPPCKPPPDGPFSEQRSDVPKAVALNIFVELASLRGRPLASNLAGEWSDRGNGAVLLLARAASSALTLDGREVSRRGLGPSEIQQAGNRMRVRLQ